MKNRIEKDYSSSLLHTENLSIGYRGKLNKNLVIFENINVSAGHAELVALFGANGIGKSTLLRNLVKLQQPISGKIFVSGKNLDRFTGRQMAHITGFVSTEKVLVNDLSVYDLVSFGRHPYTNWIGRLTNEDSRSIEEAIEMVGISNLRKKPINQLSDGERQRAMIARTLAQDTKIIILDEPTAFLDLPNKYQIVNLLHQLASEKKKTIIFSTHDLNIAIQEASRIWLMVNGKIYQGAPEDLILNGKFEKMFEKTRLFFDKNKAEFRIERKPGKKIGLRGPDPEFRWTRNALERIGLEVTDRENTSFAVEIEKDNTHLQWALKSEQQTNSFQTIYDLCTYLSGRSI